MRRPRSVDSAQDEAPLILHVARLAAIKHQTTTIKALAQTKAQLAFVGGVQPGYPDQLSARAGKPVRGLGNARALPFHGRFAGGASTGLEQAGDDRGQYQPGGAL